MIEVQAHGDPAPFLHLLYSLHTCFLNPYTCLCTLCILKAVVFAWVLLLNVTSFYRQDLFGTAVEHATGRALSQHLNWQPCLATWQLAPNLATIMTSCRWTFLKKISKEVCFLLLVAWCFTATGNWYYVLYCPKECLLSKYEANVLLAE